MTRELELCPFCKGEALLKNDADLGDIFYKEWVQCNDCGASAPIEAWNTRAVTEKQALLNKIAEAAINEGWQPIETAPRDGTVILVKDFGSNLVFQARYNVAAKSFKYRNQTGTAIKLCQLEFWKPLKGELDKLVAEYKDRFGDE